MHEYYENPLSQRYAGEKMKRLFSDSFKFSTFRRLWIALAESQKELGLDITDQQIEQMKQHVDDINFETAEKYEHETRHDVMAQILAYGDQCPDARGIIHLGATSCYVDDNTDIIRIREGLLLIRDSLVNTIALAEQFARRHAGLPTLAYTHYQPAQPTTVGKRACLWINDLMMDLDQIQHVIDSLRFFGCKGTTGTCASFLELFRGDEEKCLKLEQLIAQKMGFDSCYPVSGQTYSRKVDFQVLSALSGIGQSAAKFSNDIRLLSHDREVEEPFGTNQVGSSAMAYKRNPMRSERMASLSRYLMNLTDNAAATAAGQWFERTLDDSANRRISIPEAFLACDGILRLYSNIISGLRIFPEVIKAHLDNELPFMATENILMYCVAEKGGDRQKLHEIIRQLSVKEAEELKNGKKENQLLEKILNNEAFNLTEQELGEIIDPIKFTGMAQKQCLMYLDNQVKEVLDKYHPDQCQGAQINI